MAEVSSDEGRFDDAQAHVEQAKLHANSANNAYVQARAMRLQANVWHRQCRFEEAKSEALSAVDMLEKLGATYQVRLVRELLERIDHLNLT